MFDAERRDDVARFHAPGIRCLSTGWNGGLARTDSIYEFSVPTGWERQDIAAYAESKRQEAGFTEDGPALFTAVSLDHLRGARVGPVEVFATVGLSNPAALPMEADPTRSVSGSDEDVPVTGTVNLLVGTTRSLDDAALSNLLAVAVEAKAATLLAYTGFPGTTSDAIIGACDPDGESRQYSGSATEVGGPTRAAVRDAITASLASSYPDGDFPATVSEARYGVRTEVTAEVFRIP